MKNRYGVPMNIYGHTLAGVAKTSTIKRLSKEAKSGDLYGYPFTGQWFDTGTHEAYEKAIKEFGR